jgi:aspartate/methionine/tyrosine aminotransferase
MNSRVSQAIPAAKRLSRFSYAIRHIAEEARKVEAAGIRVRYLNIGDPVAFGFHTPPHMIDAVERALRAGENGYVASAGIPAAREAVAAEHTGRGQPIRPNRVFITAGTSEAIDLVLTALLDEGEEALVPVPTYPLYTAVLAKIGAREKYYRTDPMHGWLPDLDHLRDQIGPRTRVLVVITPNNPTGAVYPDAVRRELLSLADRHNLVLLADEVYLDVAYDGPLAPIGSLNPEVPVISLSSLSKAYLAPGWRTGWLAVGGGERLNDVVAAINKLAEGRLCSTGPMQHGLIAALTGNRSHQADFRARLREQARLTSERFNAIPGMTCVTPRAAFYAMPQLALPPGKTDVDYVIGLLRATGVLCVYGSGFNMAPEAGSFRVVFLASPTELADIYDRIADFTQSFMML